MNTLQASGRWLCAFFMSTILSTWIFTAAFDVTILNRTTIKSWLASSGVYNQALGNLVQVSTDNAGADSLITGSVLQNALSKTFTPTYLQQNTNVVIDATYDWLDGKKNTINFTIPVQQKATEFSNNLAAQLEPILAKLPSCGQLLPASSNAITCVPKGVSPADYAAQLTQPANGSQFLSTPLTQNNFGPSSSQYNYLPRTAQWMHTLLWLLPLLWLLLAVGYVALSPDKLRGLGKVGRQTAINSALALLAGLLLWYGTPSIDLTNSLAQGDAQQTEVIKAIANPLARTILPDVGKILTLFSAMPFVLGGGLWMGTFLWRRHVKKEAPIAPPDTTQETQLPSPTNTPPTAVS